MSDIELPIAKLIDTTAKQLVVTGGSSNAIAMGTPTSANLYVFDFIKKSWHKSPTALMVYCSLHVLFAIFFLYPHSWSNKQHDSEWWAKRAWFGDC